MSSGPHPSVPLTQAQIAQQQQAQAHAHELARRRSRKPTDKNIPEGVEDSIVNQEAVQRYKALRDVERTLDATITRKRLDVSEACSRNNNKVCDRKYLLQKADPIPCVRPHLANRTFSSPKHFEFGLAIRLKINLGRALG